MVIKQLLAVAISNKQLYSYSDDARIFLQPGQSQSRLILIRAQNKALKRRGSSGVGLLGRGVPHPSQLEGLGLSLIHISSPRD